MDELKAIEEKLAHSQRTKGYYATPIVDELVELARKALAQLGQVVTDGNEKMFPDARSPILNAPRRHKP